MYAPIPRGLNSGEPVSRGRLMNYVGLLAGSIHAHLWNGCRSRSLGDHRKTLGQLVTNHLNYGAQANASVQGLPFSKVIHRVSTLDAQPSSDNGILVLVTGALLVRWPRLIQLLIHSMLSISEAILQTYLHGALRWRSMTRQVDEEQRPMNYTQAFQLLPDGAGSYFIFNDVFRLIYG